MSDATTSEAEPLFDAVVAVLDAEGWAFDRLGTRTALTAAFQGEAGQWTVAVMASEKQRRLVAYSIAPLSAPAERRAAVAEFLTRANYGLPVGNFEMDLDDGEVRFKTAVDLADALVTDGLIRSLIHANVVLMDRYVKALHDVAIQGGDPAAAIKAAEATAGSEGGGDGGGGA